MLNLPIVLYRKVPFLIYWNVCVFVLPFLYAQDSGWNGYQLQSNNRKSTTEIPVDLENENKLQFYLLRTGFLTKGTATNDGKQYLLKTDFGTMSVPVANVEFVGATLEEVYHYKKGSVNVNDCNELIKLAEWCLSNKLPQQGMMEYQRALQTAPNPVLADVIRKRLETLQKPSAVSNGLSEVPAELALSSEESDDLEMSRWINGIPKPIVESFAKKIQPVLVSRCAATDCHGSMSDNQLKLRIPHQMFGNTTYRNLRSVLQWIDLDYPMDSQLLSVLVSYHGGTKAAFSVESTQYNNIVQWARLAAKELPMEYHSQMTANKNDIRTDKKESNLQLQGNVLPPALRNAMIVSPSVAATNTNQPEIPNTTFVVPPNSNSVPVETSPVLPSNYTRTRLNLSSLSHSLPSDLSNSSSNSSILQKSGLSDSSSTSDSPKDPFDPNIFNSKYHRL
jgi:hypothetical protein